MSLLDLQHLIFCKLTSDYRWNVKLMSGVEILEVQTITLASVKKRQMSSGRPVLHLPDKAATVKLPNVDTFGIHRKSVLI